MRMQIDLEPELPEGATVETVLGGYKVHGIEPIQPIALPGNPQSLTKLRAVIDHLIYESERGHETKSISRRIGTLAKTSATVLAIVVMFLFALPARAQTIGDFVRLVDAIGKLNARTHERPASELRKPCRVGDRIYVEGVWYDCKPKGANRSVVSSQLDNSTRLTGNVRLTTARDRLYRTRLSEAAGQPANFMRHWVLTYWGCGMDCLMGAAVDKETGRVVWLPFFVTEWSRDDLPYLPGTCAFGQVASSNGRTYMCNSRNTWVELANGDQPFIFQYRNGTLLIPRGILVYDHGTGYAPQTWRLFRGRFVRAAK